MAIKNTPAVYIGGINYTHNVVMPLKWGNFLDEQLDEMIITLSKVKRKVFSPLTPVEVRLKNVLYWGQPTNPNKIWQETKQFIIANDNATESPVGKGLYDHELYCIELTKILECIIVDTCTFTNDLGRTYTKNQRQVNPDVEKESSPGSIWQDNRNPVTPSTFVSPLQTGNFYFPSAHTIFPYETIDSAYLTYAYYWDQTVLDPNGGQVFYNRYYINNLIEHGEDIGANVNLVSGIYTVIYRYEAVDQTDRAYRVVTATYQFTAVENRNPLKQWTITDVCNRLFAIAEPLRRGEKPRFYLQGIDPVTGDVAAGSQAEKYEKILAPQFSFTKQTLRECLQQIGGVVHGEPRAKAVKDSSGKYYYEISFDEYGGTVRDGIYTRKYIKETVSQIIESYASHLDTNAENLVNQLDKYAGVIVEPYASGYKTVRTETMYTRITEENMLIATQFPIYSIEKVEVGYIQEDGSNVTPPLTDITAYVFESTVYNSQLSSYESEYPYSKAYGLMYTQGEKNITALNFKQEHPIDSSFENYAIVNILRAATGDDSLTISGTRDSNGYYVGWYPLLAFRVTYTPFYGARVEQSKVNYTDFPYGAGLIYNQSANVIESRYYGENLKGAIARLGNVEISKTYNLARLTQIPKAGTLYNDDYYISAVAVEFLPTYIKCTIGLSKDFNRLSKYIGISSVKRYSEVSQGQALERSTLWREFIVAGDELEADTDGFTRDLMLEVIADTFTQSGTEDGPYKPFSAVYAHGTSYSGGGLSGIFGRVILPVISSAFGNSISFSWEYEDNYSAGAVSQYANAGEGSTYVSGYFQNSYQYTDYYGRIYYYHFALMQDATAPTSADSQNTIGKALPGRDGQSITYLPKYLSTINSDEGEDGSKPIILRKDNREKLQCNVQLDFVTNRKGLIIGSALASYCPAVRGSDSKYAAKLYVFQEPLNKFIDHVEGSLDIDFGSATAYDITVSAVSDGKFTVTAGNFAVSGKAWAICTPQTEGETETVEDEEGDVYEQTPVSGGDVLLAQNMDISAGDAFPTIYFTKKREVFNKSVWTDIR